ncbi:MAG: YceI family protein [Crocinitomicaceae bacterium]|nr:YceI family protein [Crocinitomicaceae bacterium]
MESLVSTKWAIDPSHSEIGFKVIHMMISSVKGHFKSFEATVEATEDDFSDAKVKVSIDADSIYTNNEDRDNHLKSDDFLNAEKYPKITFESTSFDGKKLVGDLTIRDITKQVELKVEHNGTAVDGYGQTKAGFEIRGEINRKDFDLKWDQVTEAGNVVVSDMVKLIIDAEFTKEEE